MPWFVKMYRRLCSAALLLGLVASAAHAEPIDERELRRFVPSFAFWSGVTAQNIEGYLSESGIKGPRAIPPGSTLPSPQIVPGSPLTERARMMGPFVGGSLELMTPALVELPTRPRAYARAELSYVFGPEYVVPKEGDPGAFINSPNVTSPTELTILGQGATTTVVLQPLMVTAGVGLAFTVEVGERALRIKPSFEYIRQEVEIRGMMRRAVQISVPSPTLDNFRQITLAAERTVVYHGIGPGIELELDTRRAGPFVLSLFAAGKGWSLRGNQKQYLFASNEWDESALFYALSNEWAFSGALGLRFRWVPE